MSVFCHCCNTKRKEVKLSSSLFKLKQLKLAFFSESAMCFSNLPKKIYTKSLSWTWNLNLPLITVNNLFKFQAQNSDLFWKFWKTNCTFWKKPPLVRAMLDSSESIQKFKIIPRKVWGITYKHKFVAQFHVIFWVNWHK